MSATTYTVSITGGMHPEYSDPMSKGKAIKTAGEWAKSAAAGEQVFIEFFRAADGQKGYLNADGNHAVTGEAW